MADGSRAARRGLAAAAVALAAVGAAISGYLTWTHLADVAPVCATGGCEIVQRSEYSELLGVPVALLGLVHYLVVGALVVAGARVLATVLAGAGLLFTLYLLVIQVAVIDAICTWCVANDVVAAALLLVLLLGLRVSERGRAPAA